MDSKILNLNDAFIKPYPTLTMLLSILQHNPRALAWVCENYFSMSVYTGPEYKGIDTSHNFQKLNIREWTACPFLRKYLYPYQWVNQFWDSLSNLIVKAIQDDQYIYLLINTKFVSAYKTDIDRNHQIFIYGQYTLFETDFQSINTAFKEAVLKDDDVGGICGLQIQDPRYEIMPNCQSNYLFSIKSLYLSLLKYLNPEINQTEYTLHNSRYYSGIDAYAGIRVLLKMKAVNTTSIFSVYANKVIIQKAFELANLADVYKEDLNYLVSESHKIVMLHIKSNISSQKNDIDSKILFYLQKLEKAERAFFERVVQNLVSELML